MDASAAPLSCILYLLFRMHICFTVANCKLFFLSFFRRVLVSGQVLSSLGYRHGKTNDYTLCYAMSPKYGLAVKYVSYCLEDCPPDHGYCQHSILVRPLYPVGEPFVVNEETGASATHIQAVKPGRSEYGCTLLN